MKSPWSDERSIRFLQTLRRRSTSRFGLSTSQAKTTYTHKTSSRLLNYRRHFAEPYRLPSNSALVTDACVAALRAFFSAAQRGR
jgi:hypothetical protein